MVYFFLILPSSSSKHFFQEMEFSQWRKSIGDIIAVTEQNLKDDGFSATRHQHQHQHTSGRSSAWQHPATPREYEQTPQEDRLPPSWTNNRNHNHDARRSMGSTTSQNAAPGTQVALQAGPGVLLDSSLAYRIDNMTLQMSVLQKDFDQYKASKMSRDEHLKMRQDETQEDFVSMRGEWSRWEKRVGERLEYIEETALTAQNSIYKRMPGVGVDDAVRQENEDLKGQVEALTRRLLVLERSQGPDSRDLRQMMTQIVEDELAARLDDIKRDASQSARKAASQELRCKLEAAENDIRSRADEESEKLKTGVARSLSEYKASVEREVEMNVSQALQTAATVKQSMSSLLMWKDVVDARLDDTDRDSNAQIFKLKTAYDERFHETRTSMEKLVADMDEKCRRRVEQSTLLFVTEERLQGMCEQLKSDVHGVSQRADILHNQQQTLRVLIDERTNGAASELRASIDSARGMLGKSVDASREELQHLTSEMSQSKQTWGDRARELDADMKKTRASSTQGLVALDRALRDELKTLQHSMRDDCEALLADALNNKAGAELSPRFKEQRAYSETLRTDVERMHSDFSRFKQWAEKELEVLGGAPPIAASRPPLPSVPLPVYEEGAGWSSGYETGATQSSALPSSPDGPSLHAKHIGHLAGIAQAVRTLQCEVSHVYGRGSPERTLPADDAAEETYEADAAADDGGGDGGVEGAAAGAGGGGGGGYSPDANVTLRLIERFKTTANECTIDTQLEGLSLHMSDTSDKEFSQSCATSDVSGVPSPSAARTLPIKEMPVRRALVTSPTEDTDTVDSTPTAAMGATGTRRRVLPLPADEDTASSPSSVTSEDIFPYRRARGIEDTSTNT